MWLWACFASEMVVVGREVERRRRGGSSSASGSELRESGWGSRYGWKNGESGWKCTAGLGAIMLIRISTTSI